MGPVGLPRRNLGRLVSLEESVDVVLRGASCFSAGFWSGLLWVFFSSFFSSGSGVLGTVVGAAPGVDPEGAVFAAGVEGATEGGAAAGGGALGAPPELASPFVSLGGASVFSIPTGATSAFIPVFGASAPPASQAQVAIQGTSALAARLCSALLMVNRPRGLPVFSPS